MAAPINSPSSPPPEGPPSPRKRHALELFAGLPDRYDRVGAGMSFGQDPRWRKALVEAVDPRPGQRILDVATGTGMVAFALARKGADVVGLDQSEQMLAQARKRLEAEPREITFIQGEAERIPFADQEFDGLTFTYLLRYVDDPRATLRELARVVKPGGRIGMIEFGVPRNPLLKPLWRLHTRVVLPAIGRVISPAWLEVGRFLGPSIEQLYDGGPGLAALWRAAGITNVHTRSMSFGAGVVMWGTRAP